MAFVLHQTWDASTGAWAASETRNPLLASLLADGRDRYYRSFGATIFSVIVHILLIWLLLNKLAGNVGEGKSASAGSARLMQFSLWDPATAAAAMAGQKQMIAQRATAPVSSELDLTVPTELPAPEWTMSRLPPSAAQPQSLQASTVGVQGGASAGGAGAGAGQGGSAVYDPFAGAAPLRREREDSAAGLSLGDRVLDFFGFGQQTASGLILDEAALEAVRRAVAQSLPGRGGTAEMAVRVSPTGVVLEASARGGSAPAEARNALGRALVGKRLYRGSPAVPQLLNLPALSLG